MAAVFMCICTLTEVVLPWGSPRARGVGYCSGCWFVGELEVEERSGLILR